MIARLAAAVLLLSVWHALVAPLALAQGRQPVWMTDPAKNCSVWNDNPLLGESMRWSGACVGGHASGHGVVQWLEEGRPGDRYEGELEDGLMDGRGVYTWADGDRYDGEFRGNRRNGHGVSTFTSGDRYEGDYKDGSQEGRGVYTWRDGRRFEGEFKADQLVRGVYTAPNGDRYEGNFADGKPHGQGTYIYAHSSATYQGEWRNGRPNGQGTYRNADRRSFSGVWNNGCLRDGVSWQTVGVSPWDCTSSK